MAGAIALINMIGGLLGGFAGQYAIGLIREKTGGYGAALAAMAGALLISALIVQIFGRKAEQRQTITAIKAEGNA